MNVVDFVNRHNKLYFNHDAIEFFGVKFISRGKRYYKEIVFYEIQDGAFTEEVKFVLKSVEETLDGVRFTTICRVDTLEEMQRICEREYGFTL